MANMAPEIDAGVFEKLKRLWAYWRDRLGEKDIIQPPETPPPTTTTTTTAQKPKEPSWSMRSINDYIAENKPKDADEKEWLMQRYREFDKVPYNPNGPNPSKIAMQKIRDYMMEKHPEYLIEHLYE